MSNHGLRFAIESSIREAMRRSHEYVTVEHLLFALTFEKVASDVIESCGGDKEAIQTSAQGGCVHIVPPGSHRSPERPILCLFIE